MGGTCRSGLKFHRQLLLYGCIHISGKKNIRPIAGISFLGVIVILLCARNGGPETERKESDLAQHPGRSMSDMYKKLALQLSVHISPLNISAGKL